MKKRFLTLILIAFMNSFLFVNTIPSVFATEKEPVEIISLRSEYEKHFDNGDGTITAFVSTEPLHYYKDGEWVEIDNTLIFDENGKYINTSNPMNVTLASHTSVGSIYDMIDKPMVSIEQDEYSISWSLINNSDELILKNTFDDTSNISLVDINLEKSTGIEKSDFNNSIAECMDKLESNVSYDSIYDNVDMNIDIKSSSVKETIILNDCNNIPEKFSYYIKSDGLIGEMDEYHSVHFINENGEEIFSIPAPFMFDSSDSVECNYNIEVEFEKYEDGYLYSIIPDNEWLLDESRAYPVMIDPEVTTSDYKYISSYYNSEANPYSVFRDIYLKIGNETDNGYQSYVFLPNSFSNYGDYATIKNAKFNLYFLPNSMESDKTISVYSNQTKPNIDFWWEKASGLNQYNTYISSFNISKNTSNYTRYSADITSLVQSWLNYAETSSVGIPNYGFKLVSKSGTGSTVTAYSERSKYYKPYYEITYSISSEYILDYAPHKYNNIYTQNSANINNFQNRMNCYAYALQVYYRGDLESLSQQSYFLKPGEFGIRYPNVNDKYSISKYSDLILESKKFTDYIKADIYYPNRYLPNYMDFVQEQMYRDANALNYNIQMFQEADMFYNNQFDLPNNFDENSERIIAMIVYFSHISNTVDYHYYVRNGNGTCPNSNHDENCSIWTHKRGNQPISNKSVCCNNILCDQNITALADDFTSREYSMGEKIRYYKITKNTNIYNSSHEYGQNDNSTGTPYNS